MASMTSGLIWRSERSSWRPKNIKNTHSLISSNFIELWKRSGIQLHAQKLQNWGQNIVYSQVCGLAVLEIAWILKCFSPFGCVWKSCIPKKKKDGHLTGSTMINRQTVGFWGGFLGFPASMVLSPGQQNWVCASILCKTFKRSPPLWMLDINWRFGMSQSDSTHFNTLKGMF